MIFNTAKGNEGLRTSRGRVENNMSRRQQQVSFCKRRNGLLKKAYDELYAVFCYAVFSSRGRLYGRLRHQQLISSPMKWTSFWTLLFGSFLLCSVVPVESVSSDHWDFYCGNETFAKNSHYEKSLNSIAEKLPAEVSIAPSYFHSISSSSKTENIYAAGLCREDSSPAVCKICIRQAFHGVGVWCPFRKVSAIVFDRCSLWMSNREFVHSNFDGFSFLRYNTSRALIDMESLGKGVVGVVTAVAVETAKSAARFAVAHTQIGGPANGYTVHAFAQCIPRVTKDCRFCLEDLITANPFLPKSVGGASVALWCQFRWELYPFITGVTPTFIKGKHEFKHKDWKRNFIILSAAVGSAVLVVLLIVSAVIWWRNRHSSMTTPAGERLERVEMETGEEKKCVETGEGSSSNVKVLSDTMLEIPKEDDALPTQHPLPLVAEACSRMDLHAIHQILVTTHYRDDEESTELSFEGWTQQAKDVLGARKRGDSAFKNREFRIAINCYSRFVDAGTEVSPTVFARRSLCYLMRDNPEAALRDAMLAQAVCPDWSTAFYLQSVALSKMNMHDDAANMLNEASQMDEKRRQKGKFVDVT